MDAIFLGHARTNGCRTTYFFPYLEKAGVRARYVEAPGGEARLGVIRSLPRSDALFVQRLVLSPAELEAAKTRTSRLVWDVDDPIFQRSSRHLLKYSPRRRSAFRRMAAAADAFLAGSRAIAQEALKVLPPGKVAVVPSTVDAAEYRPDPSRRDPAFFTLGWLGSPGTLPYLERLGPALREARRRDGRIRVKVVSSRFPSFPVERKTWRKEDEVADLQTFDAGLLPLTEDAWTRGKGHGKLFQYLAVGIPVLASPVGIVADTLKEGRTGLLCRSRKDWVEGIESLAKDPARRREMGRLARIDFEQNLSVEAVVPSMLKALIGKDLSK